jgi:hypothetical protein
VYNEDVSIDFSANVAPFSASLTQAIKQLESFGASADGAVGKVNLLNTATLSLVKGLGKFLDLNKTSTAAAAAYQQKLSGLATTTALNEKQFKGLSDVALKFGREFPIGLDKSVGLVKALNTSGVNTTKSIKELGTAFIKIQAATGEWGGQFVADMLSVNRSFGNSMSSVGKFGDSLVTVSNKFGASAGSVIGFTKALAPFSSAMGMNATSTMGLSTAFSRLGEDGTRSANALNKVMLDLTKSVKTGSPEVRQYAAVMNMTTEALTDLVNTDPSEAIIRFTEAINKQGPKAMSTLNRLGIDGIQTFKSLQALGKSTDLREILQTSREAYGSGSAQKGAEVALGGVNDQMSKIGESMSQTIAVAGTPFLQMIETVLSVMNSVAEAVNKVTSGIARLAQNFAPLLVAAKVLLASFQAIAAIQFARFLGNAFQNNTQMGRSLAAGRADASYGITQPGGNAMYRMGAAIEDNRSGIMGRSFRENAGLAYQGVKGALGYGVAGYMNLTSNLLRSDPSEAARSQLATRNFSENFRAARAGGDIMGSRERAVTERYNRIATAEGRAPIAQAQDPTKAMGSMKAMSESFKQFGKDLATAGASAKMAGGIQMTAGGELAAAFKGLAAMTMKATVEVGKLALAAAASGVMMIGKQLGMMAAIGVAIAAFTSIKGGIDKSNKVYKDAMGADLGSAYNDFAEKAGLATVSISMLSSAARDAARSLIMNNKTLDEANKLTGEEIAAAKNPNYKSAKDFGEGRSVQDLTNAVLNLQGNSPDAQARAQLLMDITSQYGAGTAIEVSGNLTGEKAPGATEQKGNRSAEAAATTRDVYSAGLEDYTRNKDNRWWGGRTENDASRASLINIRSNLAQNVENVAGVYGQKAGNVASFVESEKLLKAAVASGSGEQFKAAKDAISQQLGVELTGNLDDFKNKTLFEALNQTDGLTEAERSNRKNVLGNVAGVDLNNVDYSKLYNANDKPQNVKNMEAADEAFRKVNKAAEGLSSTFFEATQISLKYNANLADISEGGKRADIYQQLSATERASVDLANKPNDPIALNTKSLQLLSEALEQNGGDITNAMQQLSLASQGAVTGSSEKNMALAAYAMAQQQQNIANAGLSFTTRSQRDIKVGQAAQAGGMPSDPEDQERYQAEINAMQQAQAQQLAMVKQFAEARRSLDIQLETQMEDYQRNVLRSNRDFNRQLTNQDADYRKNVKRANEDFKLSRERQSQDFAKSVFNPFQRVAAVRTTDAYSLVGNLKKQNAIIKEQMQNLAKLKKLGLSQQSIDTLDLMNPANAQEVARLLIDMTANKSLIEQTNAEVKTRNAYATQWTNSTMNQSFNRAQADFDKQINRGAEDYNTAVQRAVAAHKTALGDMLTDLTTARTRAFAQLARFGEEIDVTAENAEKILNGAFEGMPQAAKNQMSDAIKALQTAMKDFKPATIVFPTTIAAPTKTQITEASELYASASVAIAAQSKITAVDGTTGVDENGNFAWFNKGKWHVYKGMGQQWEKFTQNLKTGATKPEDLPAKWWTQYGKSSVKIYNAAGDQYKFAQGGMVHGPGNGKSDSIDARLSNGEYVVQADAVRKYGQSFLDNVNAQKLANASYVHGNDSKMSSMQGYASNITNNTSTQFDQSTQINGPITVQSTDPNQFMRQMQAKKRFARLTQPAGN